MTQISTRIFDRELARINKVGIELEGAFINRNNLDSSLGKFKGDCSVEDFDDFNNGNFSTGEFVSIPLTVDQIESFVLNNYPDKTNHTCGGHFHVSLKSASDYMDLMSEDFYNYYLREMTQWAKDMNINPNSQFWERLRGKRFTERGFYPIEQRNMTEHYDSYRYYHINYCYNVDNRHTVEFRMLPCFQKSTLLVSGYLKTCEIIENYLENLNQNQNKVTMEIRL